MRWFAFLVALFTASPALAAVSADGPCAAQTDKVCWDTDWALEGSPTGYNTVVDATIAGAMGQTGYADLPSDARQGIWDSINEAALNACVVTVGLPAAYPADDSAVFPDCNLAANNGPNTYTRAEMVDTYGAKVAHALCHDLAGSFLWKLSDWGAYVDGLFNLDRLFPQHGSSCSSGLDRETATCGVLSESLPFDWSRTANVGHESNVVDHHPNEALTVALSMTGETLPTLIGPDQVIAAVDTWVNTDPKLRHSVSTDPCTPISVKNGVDLARNAKPTAPTLLSARGGCHFTAWLYAALARSMNIPAYPDNGWTNGENHSHVSFPTLNLHMNHGDDPYGSRSVSVGMPPLRYLVPYSLVAQHARDPWEYVSSPVQSEARWRELTGDAAYNTDWVQHTDLYKDYWWPSQQTLNTFCTDPTFWSDTLKRHTFEPLYEPCQSSLVLDAYNRLVLMSGGCDGGGF